MIRRFFASRRTLWSRGRFSLLWEPRDMWGGVYHGETADYIVVVPMFPLRIQRGDMDGSLARRAHP